MRFYLGTHETSWLGRSGVPLFVSAPRLRRRKRAPRAVSAWALDSGGFSELSKHGRWSVGPNQYADEVMRWADEAGSLDWAAPQDWMCEPVIRAETGLTVEAHQERTIASVLRLRELVRGTHIVPVLQGWAIPDYVACVRRYEAAGIRLQDEPVVGLGTVCRRQGTKEGAAIVRTLASAGIRLHGFGFKLTGLRAVGHLLESSDSLAWSYAARKVPPMPGHTHKSCANCMPFAMAWRGRVVTPRELPAQVELFT